MITGIRVDRGDQAGQVFSIADCTEEQEHLWRFTWIGFGAFFAFGQTASIDVS